MHRDHVQSLIGVSVATDAAGCVQLGWELATQFTRIQVCIHSVPPIQRVMSMIACPMLHIRTTQVRVVLVRRQRSRAQKTFRATNRKLEC